MPFELPGYEIIEELHRGRKTVVYRGRRTKDHEPVVIKVIRPDEVSPFDAARLHHEHETMKRAAFSGVVKVHAIEHYHDIHALVLEDFGGVSLKRIIQSRRLDFLTVLQIASQLAEILSVIHERNIIHKDINPNNIIINPDTGQVKVTDFGIASLLVRETANIGSLNGLEGSLPYISPEQTGRMNRTLDYRTDLYSLGVTLFELLIGWVPFQSTEPMELIHSHIAKMPSSPSDLNLDVPHSVSEIVLKLLAKTAEERYRSARGLKADLDRCLREWQATGRIAHFLPGENDATDRFSIPQHLYGREKEIAALLHAFERVSNGSSEVMLVSGHPGIGKSALIHEIHKPITGRRGFFISGKFDQFKRNIPYASLAQAFQEFIRQLLTGTDEELNVWKTNLRDALGQNGQVLVKIIPELELVVGEQPVLPDLPAAESQNRFNRVFLSFISAIARPDHPFVLFLDDLQWADAASLKVIQLLLAESRLKYVLLLGSYRENEIDSGHPLPQALSAIRESGTPVQEIALRPFDHSIMIRLIADALQVSPEQAAPLAVLVQQKTGGNPYFVNEFLKSLHHESLLTFDSIGRKWNWDLGEIQKRGITDNVVTLMAGKIQQLPPQTQNAVQLASCIGNTFDLFTLSLVYGHTQARTATDLWPAIEEGLLLPIGDAYKFVHAPGSETATFTVVPPTHYTDVSYKFAHDRVRQSAYSLIPEGQRSAFHLAIGKALLEKTGEEQRDERIFDIVNQFNLGASRVREKALRYQLARLNLQAGKKAKDSAAFEAALKYMTTGRTFLDEDWSTDYDLSLELFRECGECEYLTGGFEASEKLFDMVISRASTNLDKARTFAAKVMLYTHIGNHDRAIEAGLIGLKLVGVHLARRPSKATVGIEILRSKWALRGRSIPNLSQLPRMNAPAPRVAIDILTSLMIVAYSSSAELSATVITRLLNTTLRHGIAEASSYAFALYGLLLGAGLRSYKAAYEFGNLAITVSQQSNNLLYQGRSNFVMGAVIHHWRKHAKLNLEYLTEARSLSMESGDLQFVASAHTHLVLVHMFIGTSLDDVFEKATEYLEYTTRIKFDDFAHEFISVRQMVMSLKGQTNQPGSFDTADFREDDYIPKLSTTKFVVAKMYYVLRKMQTMYLFGQFVEAGRLASESRKLLYALMGQLSEAEFNFYHSLICAARCSSTTSPERRMLIRTVKKNQRMMKRWSHHCPENFMDRYLLVEAELARLQNEVTEAMDLYEKAILTARTHGFIQNEALANELAAQFYISQGKRTIAAPYMRESRRAYTAWGATAKVSMLQRSYGDLLHDEASQQQPWNISDTTTLYSGNLDTKLDLISVLKASQALSGEIVLAKLLDRMMQIVVENAGAERGCFLMEKGTSLFIVAEREERTNDAIALRSLPVEQSKRICLSLVQYVARTKDRVVLNDAATDSRFASDTYVLENKPKSILCVPILHQGKISALLYLENNLIAGAFTQERVEVLHLLSSQIAISIENARLYEQEKAFVRMQEEVRLASQIQQNLLPKTAPGIPGYEIAGTNIPAQMVGGDYFDFIPISEHRWAICLGDVSGKGLPASLLMANLQATLRGQTLLDAPPGECLHRSNKLLFQSTGPEKFATLFYGILDTRDHTFTFANAGHDNPFVMNRGVQKARLKTGGIPLGMIEEFSFDHDCVSLVAGDTIVMYSDGIPEAMNEQEEFFGEEQLATLLALHHSLTTTALMEKIVEEVKQFAGTTPQSDDMTIVVVRRTS
jgi:predicted ATPase/serine phosphatase RsbU (regulator of sigma subunit)/tRNA A-37 threonylcarbamoyl transferase component Bud32